MKLLLLLSVLALSACVVVDDAGTANANANQGTLQRTIGPGMVIVSRNGETVSVLRTAAPNIEAADFIGRGQSQIAIKSRGAHGPATCELFDTQTGQLRDKVMAFAIRNGQPAWASRYAE